MTQKIHFNNKKELTKYINYYIHNILKEYKYKKNGNDFYLESNDFSKIISIEVFRHSDESELEFFLNWGLYFYMSEYFYKKKKQRKPSYSQSLIMSNISDLKDKTSRLQQASWKLFTNSKSEYIKHCLNEVEYYIRNYALPFLEKMNKLEDVIEMLETTKEVNNKDYYGFYPSHINPYPFIAILHCYNNNKEKSLNLIDNIISTTKVNSCKEGMISLKEKVIDFDPLLYMNKP